MAANSKIEWTNHTFNPWIGCTKVHEGCTHCYAESFAKRTGKAKWGPGGTRVKTSADYWKQPIKWNREAKFMEDERPRVFCASLADVFEDWTGPVLSHTGQSLGVGEDGILCFEGVRPATLDDLRRNLFALIDATPNLDWLLLTKRPENIHSMWPKRMPVDGRCGHYKNNVWLGTSISNQETANKFVLPLVKCRDLARVLFLSAEPLLGGINLGHLETDGEAWNCLSGIGGPNVDCVIVGGESGHGSRPMHPQWAQKIRDDCTSAGVSYFFKQWGEWSAEYRPGTSPELSDLAKNEAVAWGDGATNHVLYRRVGKKVAGRNLDGRTWDELPRVAGCGGDRVSEAVSH